MVVGHFMPIVVDVLQGLRTRDHRFRLATNGNSPTLLTAPQVLANFDVRYVCQAQHERCYDHFSTVQVFVSRENARQPPVYRAADPFLWFQRPQPPPGARGDIPPDLREFFRVLAQRIRALRSNSASAAASESDDSKDSKGSSAKPGGRGGRGSPGNSGL